LFRFHFGVSSEPHDQFRSFTVSPLLSAHGLLRSASGKLPPHE
jgi:hypothetical protein